ncbi:hypothetical protein [Flavisolibacter ginsenosidimutans]|uniref:Uncharacterized protein n=1 Tax=Flavisolibacter ginsenosidimutans TaxID=661481 RepID=A0A5B8UDV1_9BACT|nr:hypothetical protein [Flavisolibacter ginsenosidimutans]QEC54673.1 hypothetical protein FSB75_01740 [Flavisolibacter ginsenosidimutans]
MRKPFLSFFFLVAFFCARAQDTAILFRPDTLVPPPDIPLRIINLNPYFTLHVDSTLSYQLQINKNPDNYFWFLKNAPVGLKIGKDNGLITFRADKAYFLSGKLRYDVPYKVMAGVQNLNDPKERVDTSFSVVFFNTDIVPSKLKPTVYGNIWVEEGEPVSFRIMCETGSFPIESILMTSSLPIKDYSVVQKCGDEFNWTPDYDVAKESDTGKAKNILLSFIGTTKMGFKDTATVRIIVRDALNYPVAVEEFQQAAKNVDRYVLQLKFTFLQLDQKLRKTKGARTTFDLTSASTSLTGTILSTSSDQGSQRTGKILPSVGLALVPIKEAAVPTKAVDQNQASQIRSNIKRLEYMRQENQLVGKKDPDILRKTAKLKDELKQVQMQLIDVPIELTNDLSEEELNRYFNSPKVNKKYRLKG